MSDPVFMFCTHILLLGATRGTRSSFLILGNWSHFRRYRGCRVQFQCFALPDQF
jgi:hypothetical protein